MFKNLFELIRTAGRCGLDIAFVDRTLDTVIEAAEQAQREGRNNFRQLLRELRAKDADVDTLLNACGDHGDDVMPVLEIPESIQHMLDDLGSCRRVPRARRDRALQDLHDALEEAFAADPMLDVRSFVMQYIPSHEEMMALVKGRMAEMAGDEDEDDVIEVEDDEVIEAVERELVIPDQTRDMLDDLASCQSIDPELRDRAMNDLIDALQEAFREDPELDVHEFVMMYIPTHEDMMAIINARLAELLSGEDDEDVLEA